MNEPTFADRLRYQFDNFMSRGTVALIAGLGIISVAIITTAAAVLTFFGVSRDGAPIGFGEGVWASLMRTLDAGTMGGDAGWGFRFIMLLVTLGGIFVISALIGVLNTGLETKLESLRKGRSRVIESNHTVILGWSQQVFPIVSELVEANANQRSSCIVILGDKDRVEMEMEIREIVGSTRRTRIVCRTGSPISLNDLDIVSLHTARSIIVLSPPGNNPDTSAIKTILAITNNPDRKPEPYHIVAEITDPKNIEAARMVGRGEVELVLTGSLVSRIIAQTCRQSGLSVVYTELLDFGGDEIYFKEEPQLVGRTFGESLFAYQKSAVIGLRTAEGPRLNPPMDTRIAAGDQIIAVSEDDDTVRLGGPGEQAVVRANIQLRRPTQGTPERTLILGWNWRGMQIVEELDNYVAPGSSVLVVREDGRAEVTAAAAGPNQLRNQTFAMRRGDTTDRATLEGLSIENFKHVIVLAYDHLDPQQADAKTLVTLLHLRDIADRFGHPFSIVSEMIDVRNRALAEVTKADDFIVSDKLVSLMMAQISENKELNAVFTDIFDPDGSEIYLKLAANYVKIGEPVNFYTVVEAARSRGEVAMGYRITSQANDAGASWGVHVNPDKEQAITFADWDRIIVLAEG